MIRILCIILFVLNSYVYAEGFYKWKDSSGVIHITDYKPEGVDIITESSEKRINKIKCDVTPNQQLGNNEIDNHGYQSEKIDNRSKSLESNLINAKNDYESCIRDLNSRMTPKSSKAKSELRAKKAMCVSFHELYVHYLKLSNHPDYIIENVKLSKEKNDISQAVDKSFVDSHGNYILHMGNEEYFNTKTQTFVRHLGGDNYIDINTGEKINK